MRFGILTISDRSSRGERPDLSGPALEHVVETNGNQVIKTGIVPDDIELIRKTIIEWIENEEIDILLTTGGTGFAPRDVTPEATRLVVERLTPGLDEAMRASSMQITKHAMLSRAVSGIRKQTIIINLPGNPKAAVENFLIISAVLAHASSLLHEDSNSEQGHKYTREQNP